MRNYLVLFIILIMIFCYFLFPEVKNPDKPLKGEWDLKAEKVWEISGYGKKPMAIPKICCISDDSTICIFDFKYRLHFVVTGSGNFETSFGKRGEGPGEVRYPHNYYSIKKKFIIFDLPKLHYFLTDGTYVKSIPIRERFTRPQVFISENEFISHPRPENGVITYINLGKSTKKVIKKVSSYKNTITIGGRLHIGIPWALADFTAGLDPQNKCLYYGINNVYLINVIDFEGNIINKFSLQREKIKITRKMQKEYDKRNPGEAKMMSPAVRKKMPKELNYFQKIQIENGLVYVFVTHFADFSKDQQIDIFSSGGKYIYRTVFKPTNGDLIVGDVFIKNDYLYTMQEERDGEQKLVKYKITLPGNCSF